MRSVEAHRPRLWGLCYRILGDRAAADDATQEALARAFERRELAHEATFEGWLYRVATNVCLDHVRRTKIERAAVTLVDPIVLADAPFSSDMTPESTLLRREDVRMAMLCCLRLLPPRMRAVLVLRDVLDLSTDQTALALDVTVENVKVLLHRARRKLADAHRIGASDPVADEHVVDAFAQCLERGDIDALTKLLAEDVWGLTDDGAGRRKPNIGVRAVSRQWANAFGRYVKADRVDRVRLNGELALVVHAFGGPLASIHFETHASTVVALRVILDPPRLVRLAVVASLE